MLPVALTCPLWWVARWATRLLASLAVVGALSFGAAGPLGASAAPEVALAGPAAALDVSPPLACPGSCTGTASGGAVLATAARAADAQEAAIAPAGLTLAAPAGLTLAAPAAAALADPAAPHRPPAGDATLGPFTDGVPVSAGEAVVAAPGPRAPLAAVPALRAPRAPPA